jgi:hypothetical protein
VQKDLDFISGKFFGYDVPKNKRYLLKYFTTDLQIAFLRYYLVFGNAANFVDHTGYYCNKWLVPKLAKRYRTLVEAHKAAKADFTEEGLETLAAIEDGKNR